MNATKRSFAPLAALLVCLPLASRAELFDRGNGLIYDDVLDITWLADANYAQTSGVNPFGFLEWDDAVAFADQLVFAGFDDWRLPTTLQPDPTCSSQTGASAGFDCTGSEMGHMFYVNLSGTANQAIEFSGDPDLALFSNLGNAYWSGTEASFNTAQAWRFQFGFGSQGTTFKTSTSHLAWPVRDGDVPQNVPLPAWAIGLLAAGLGTLGVGRSAGARIAPLKR